MRKISYKTVLLSSIGLLFPQIGAWATDCTPVPDCASLGYTKSASDCSGVTSIKCPFDTSKVFCQKKTTTPTYPCSSGFYVQVSSPSDFNNDCSIGQFITVRYPSNFICQATGRQAQQLGSGTHYPNNTATCNSAYNYALQTLIVGCCDSLGHVTTLFPNIKPPSSSYKIGDTLYINNIPAGTIISLNPRLVLSSKSITGTYKEVQNFCNSISTAGLPWGLATQGMMDIINKDRTYIDGCTYYWANGALCHMCGNDIGSCTFTMDYRDQAGGFCVSNF